jgi:putative endonuclease
MTPMSPDRTLKRPGTIAPTRPKAEKASDASEGADRDRQVAFRLGISAESRAAAYLIAKGFRILARRWRSSAGEIDIIARRRQLLIFVEVKARDTLDDAAWSVTDRQKARIAAAAEAFLARLGNDHGFTDMRFDAVLVAPGRIPRHIPGAFDAGS